MMKCLNCGCENADSAKFCRKCGTPLEKKVVSHENIINSFNGKKSAKKDNNNILIVIAAVAVILLVLLGAFMYMSSISQDSDDSDSQSMQALDDSVNSQQDLNSQPVQTAQSSSQVAHSTPSSPMRIQGGTFSTGSSLSDKTYAKIYVGSNHAGENVKVQIYYSRDGSDLNNGNIVPKTVSSDGYIEIASADAYKYYPDLAEIYLYDTSGNLLDSQYVSLSPTSGSQSF